MIKRSKILKYLTYYLFSFDFFICTLLVAAASIFNHIIHKPLRDVFIVFSSFSIGTVILSLILIYVMLLLLLLSPRISPRVYYGILKKRILLLYGINIIFIISVYHVLSLFIRDNFILSTTNNIILTISSILFLLLRFVLIKHAVMFAAINEKRQYQIDILSLILTVKNMVYFIFFISIRHVFLSNIIFYIMSFLIYIWANFYISKMEILNIYPSINLVRVKNSIIWLSIAVIILSLMVLVFQNSLNQYLLKVGASLESFLSSPLLPTIKPK